MSDFRELKKSDVVHKSRLMGSVARSSNLLKKPKKSGMDLFRQELQMDDHIITLSALAKRLDTDLEFGLETEQAAEILRIHGPNALMPPKTKSKMVIFVKNLLGGFSALLWGGVLLSLAGFTVSYTRNPNTPKDQICLAVVIFVVIMVTGLFGFFQEVKNNAIMESFQKMIPKNATIIREGTVLVISSEDIVKGDLVMVKGGDCVPADIRIIECSGLKVDMSSVTGESDPQPRSVETTDESPLETANLAFYGTNVIEGLGKGVVIATGDHTLMGHIAGLTSGLQQEETPIKRELKKFMRYISIFAVMVGACYFTLCMFLGFNIIESFVAFIAVVVANVPEGLLVTMTAALTLTAKKMKSKNCLVKNLHAIETLGSTTVICSDKTGTLTQNKMTISHVYYDGNITDVLSETYLGTESDTFDFLSRIATLCLRAEFEVDPNLVPMEEWKINGDASESAVLKFLEQRVGNTISTRLDHKKIFEVPFNSTNKYQFSIHIVPNSKSLLLVLKGAPERVVDRCETIFVRGEVLPLDIAQKKILTKALLELGYMGERVLGFADLVLPPSYTTTYPFDIEKQNYPLTGLRFIGFMSMIDPPRPGVPLAVSKCQTAGIKVIMVTGDHPITAMAIAKKVGIISSENDTVYDLAMRKNVSATNISEEEAAHCKAVVITGTELRTMQSEELDKIIEKYREIVFARTSPQQKLQIVEAFQRAEAVVAVTGDGVNDSPALKKADIGIAMGISGSDVSKEASDMILLDDNFATIVLGIEEGRLIFDNLKKSIAYMITSNIPEIAPFILSGIMNIPPPLSIMAVLIIDVGTDLWPGISLAYEYAEADIMLRPPRNQKRDHLVGMKLFLFANINIGIVQALSGFSCYFYIMSEHGFMPWTLIGLGRIWTSDINDLQDTYGQEWTKQERNILSCKCIAAYFMACVMSQVADCLISRTRRISLFRHGMRNRVLNYGIIFQVCLTIFVIWCPELNNILQFHPFDLYMILPAVPFALEILIFDEIRKYFIRRFPGGFIERETYF